MTREELEDIALLCKLNIDENEIDDILSDMEDIIGFANKITAVDVKGYSSNFADGLQNVYRKDEVVESFPQDYILKNAKTVQDGFFYLKNGESGGGESLDI